MDSRTPSEPATDMNHAHFFTSVRPSGRSTPWLAIVALMLVALGWPQAILAEQTKYVEGSVIVTFKPAASLGDAKLALGRKSLGFDRHYGWLSAKRNKTTGLVKHKTKTTAQLIAELKDDPTVESVEPDYLRWPKAVPNDTRFTDEWALHNTGQTVDGTSGTAGDDIKFLEAWGIARPTPADVVVGVIDTGVDIGHPDLAPNMWVNTAETAGNGTDDDADGYADDVNGYDFASSLSSPADTLADHGTHVAGTIAGVGNNNVGVIGVNYRAKIMGLKVSSGNDQASFSSSGIIAALQYATLMKGRGVNIVALNASYGGGGFSSAERAALQAAGDAGIVFCAAAGNESANNDSVTTYPASYRLNNMIVVAATDQNDALATFSNYGATTVDIAAPGTAILSTLPSASASVQVGSKTYTSSFLTYSGRTAGLNLSVIDCGIGNSNEFPAGVSGNIALIQRGTLTFADKMTNAKAAGAVAAIIYNNVNTDPIIFLGTLLNPGNWLPSLAISQADGFAIKGSLPTTAKLTPSADYQYLQGTSMATPHVTGAVAFAAANFPNDTVAQRIARVVNNAEPKAALKTKVKSGGRLNLLRIIDANSNGVPDWLERTGIVGPNTLRITTPSPMPGAVVGTPYSQTFTFSGGTGPYTLQLISGTVPDGLTLTGNVLSGTPTAAIATSLVLQVTDSTGDYTGDLFKLTVADLPVSVVTSADLPHAQVNASYGTVLAATGGTAPYQWQVQGQGLPSGLALKTDGSFSGSPSAYGTYHFSVLVLDSGGLTTTQALNLVVDPLPISITTGTNLPPGVRDYAYSHALSLTGGAAPFTWSLSSGTLPPGIVLAPAGGLTGTPTEAGAFNFALQVMDSGGRTKTQVFSIAIEPFPLVVTSTSPLTAGVRNVPFNAQTFTVSGGTAPFIWALSAGALPTGLKLTSAGVLSGTPTVAGVNTFTLTVTDSLGLSLNTVFQLTITPGYVLPVMNTPVFLPTTVGVPFTYKVTASNYPRSFSISGLPTGLTYSSSTGIISGRPSVGKEFSVKLRAINPAGAGPIITVPFVVNALSTGMVGTFTGLIDRQPLINGNLGSRFTLTVAASGYFTARITTGATAKSLVGYLTTTAPQINVMLGASLLSLTLDGDANALSGTYGTANVTAYRQTWSTAPVATSHPATSRVGYYSIGLDLKDDADKTSALIPHGSGYAVFTVTATGTLTVAGRTADGTSFTSATILGAGGEIPLHASLYSNLGSLTGKLTLAADGPTAFVDNTTSGTLTWSKPATKTRTYPALFGPVNLTADGKYLATRATGQIILGLPDAGLASLLFDDGGVEASLTNPDVTGFTYTATRTVVMPTFLSGGNPGKAALSINKNTGAVGGYFYLYETTPPLTRKVTFQGMIVRPATGNIKAVGYYLLPQIPVKPQTISTSPMLSGRVRIQPSM